MLDELLSDLGAVTVMVTLLGEGLMMILPTTKIVGGILIALAVVYPFIVMRVRRKLQLRRTKTSSVIIDVTSPAETATAITEANAPEVSTQNEKAKQLSKVTKYQGIYDIVIVVMAVAILGLASYQMSNWIRKGVNFNIFGLVLFAVCYLTVPIIISIDILFLNRRILKRLARYGQNTKN